MGKRYFRNELFTFLKLLEKNNSRDWFKMNQADYERSVREPALEFITDFVGPLATISPYFVADSRSVGGSLFRIQRDTRFSKDKTPYKINTGIHFRHELGRDAHAPGFYLHLQPRRCFIGVGLWNPESKVAYQIRHHLDENQSEWEEAVCSEHFIDVFQLGGESLKRPPRGFELDHPLLVDLKRTSFFASCKLPQKEVTAGSLTNFVIDRFQRAAPMMRFLCDATGVGF